MSARFRARRPAVECESMVGSEPAMVRSNRRHPGGCPTAGARPSQRYRDVVARPARPGHEDVGASALGSLEGEPMPLDAAEPRLRASRARKRQPDERQHQRVASSAREATQETGCGGPHTRARSTEHQTTMARSEAATPTIPNRRPWSMERLGAPWILQLHPSARRGPACTSPHRRTRDPTQDSEPLTRIFKHRTATDELPLQGAVAGVADSAGPGRWVGASCALAHPGSHPVHAAYAERVGISNRTTGLRPPLPGHPGSSRSPEESTSPCRGSYPRRVAGFDGDCASRGRTLEAPRRRVRCLGVDESVGTRVPKRSAGRTRRCHRSASCDPPPRPSRGHRSALSELYCAHGWPSSVATADQ